MKVSSTVLNGEREETYRKVTRLALTHRGRVFVAGEIRNRVSLCGRDRL